MNDPKSGEQQGTGEDAATNALAPKNAESSAALGTHEVDQADGANEGGGGNQKPPRYLFPRISINEFLTAVLSVASLVISALTYLVVADTSDLKTAVRHLSELATQAQRQADATNRQVAEMQDEQRPWLQAVPQIKGPLANDGGRLVIDIGLTIKNSGRTPGVSVKGRAPLKAREGPVAKILGSMSKTKGVDVLESFCSGGPNDIWKFVKEEDGADIVFPGSDDTIVVQAATDGIPDKSMTTKEGIWGPEYGVDTPPAVNLVYCVAYKTVGEDDALHTGGIISITVPEGTPGLKIGQSIPASSLKLERSPFEWRNYAD